jgi:hypothetical protein
MLATRGWVRRVRELPCFCCRLLRHDIVGTLYHTLQAYQQLTPAQRAAQRGAGRFRFQQGGPGALQGDLFAYENVAVVEVRAQKGAEVHFMGRGLPITGRLKYSSVEAGTRMRC